MSNQIKRNKNVIKYSTTPTNANVINRTTGAEANK
jgi:hypothetical protein